MKRALFFLACMVALQVGAAMADKWGQPRDSVALPGDLIRTIQTVGCE